MKTEMNMKRKAAVTASLKAMKVGLLAAVMLAAAVAPYFAQAPSSAMPKVISDGADAKSKRVDNLNQVRYIEIYLAAPDAVQDRAGHGQLQTVITGR